MPAAVSAYFQNHNDGTDSAAMLYFQTAEAAEAAGALLSERCCARGWQTTRVTVRFARKRSSRTEDWQCQQHLQKRWQELPESFPHKPGKRFFNNIRFSGVVFPKEF